jgi:hypothetical protein
MSASSPELLATGVVDPGVPRCADNHGRHDERCFRHRFGSVAYRTTTGDGAVPGDSTGSRRRGGQHRRSVDGRVRTVGSGPDWSCASPSFDMPSLVTRVTGWTGSGPAAGRAESLAIGRSGGGDRLLPHGADRSSPAVRCCCHTTQLLADLSACRSKRGWSSVPTARRARSSRGASHPAFDDAVLCTHGEVMQPLLQGLVVRI